MSDVKRPVRQVAPGPGQLDLFGARPSGEPRNSEENKAPAEGEGPAFRDGLLESQFVGAKTLRTFLEDTKQTDVFRIRDVVRGLDLSSLVKKYPGGGRPPYHPAVMLGLILFGLMRGIRSTRCLESMGRSDVRVWWLTGGLMPDHSSIARFLTRHADDLSGTMFETLTREVLKRTGSKATDLAGDGTVIQAVASRYDLLRQEVAAEQAKAARSKANEAPGETTLAAAAAHAEQVAQVAQERAAKRRSRTSKAKGNTRVSAHEPEAVNQQLKGGKLAPSYKPSVLANTDRIVVANAVHPSSETAQVVPLLDQAQRVAGEARVSRVRLDAAYFAIAIFMVAASRDIDLLVSEARVVANKRPPRASAPATPRFDKTAFVYDEASDSYVCPAGQRLAMKEREAKRSLVKYGGAPCKNCALRSQCTTSKTGRTLKRYEGEEYSEAMRVVMQHPLARAAYKQRSAMVEPVFADYQQRLRFTRFLRRGVKGARLEHSLAAMAHNLNRLLDLARRKPAAPRDGRQRAAPRVWRVLTPSVGRCEFVRLAA